MTSFTNVHNIDPIVAEALSKDTYVKVGDISVTGLVAPVQATFLIRDHQDEITTDISERIRQWIGTIIHAELAKVDLPPGGIKEQRFITEVEGWEVSGQIDRWLPEGNTLTDYKATGVTQYNRALEGAKPEWEKQVNLYAALMRRNGYTVDRCEVVAILIDHTRGRVGQAGYPASGAPTVELRCWPHEEAEAYLSERVRAYQAAAKDGYDPCTLEERWGKSDQWAVKKAGNKYAMKGGVFEDFEEATEFRKRAGVLTDLEYRPGASARCQVWCKAFPFCEQAQREFGDGHQE